MFPRSKYKLVVTEGMGGVEGICLKKNSSSSSSSNEILGLMMRIIDNPVVFVSYGLAVTIFKSVGGGVEGSHWSPRGVMITFGQGSLFSGAGAFYYSVSLTFSRSRTL